MRTCPKAHQTKDDPLTEGLRSRKRLENDNEEQLDYDLKTPTSFGKKWEKVGDDTGKVAEVPGAPALGKSTGGMFARG